MNPQQFPGDEANPELEALLQTNLSSDEKLTNIDQNTEGALVKLDEVASNTEAQIVQTQKSTAEIKEPLERIAENTVPKEVQKVELQGRGSDTDDEAFNENEAGKALWSMLRGPKGPKGETGKKGEKGDQGEKGADSTVPGPKGDKGDVGAQGKQGPQGKVGPKGPKGDKGDTGPKGDRGPEGKPAVEVDVTKILKTVTSHADQKYKENADTLVRHVASKTYNLTDLPDVDVSNVNVEDNKYILGSTTIAVGDTEPANPSVNALWVDTA